MCVCMCVCGGVCVFGIRLAAIGSASGVQLREAYTTVQL